MVDGVVVILIVLARTMTFPPESPARRYSPRSSVSTVATVVGLAEPAPGVCAARRAAATGSPKRSTKRPELAAPRRRRISVGCPALRGVGSLRAQPDLLAITLCGPAGAGN